MNKDSLIDYWGYIAFKLLALPVRVLPLPVVFFLGKALGELIYCFDSKHRAIAYVNLKTALGNEFTPCRLRRLTKNFYRSFGQNLIEIFLIPRINKEYVSKYVSVEGRRYVDEAFRRGKGVILLGVHLGSWEIANVACANLGFPMSLLIRQQRHSRLDNLLNLYRRQKGARLVLRKNETRQLIQTLKDNQAIGMTADQGGKDGTRVKFFGKEASMASGAVRLALKYDATIIPAFYTRIRGPYMKLIFFPPFELQRSADKEEDIRQNLERLSAIFEGCIRAHPAEYLWFYKIWKYSGQRNILLLSDTKAGHLLQAKTAAALACGALEEKGINVGLDTVEVKFKNKFAERAMVFSSLFAGKYHCQGCLWCLKAFLTPDSYRLLLAKKYDLVISCGSSLAPVNYVISRDSLARSIVVMRPSILAFRRFDLVIMPRHDQPARQWFGFPYKPEGNGLSSDRQSHSQSHRPPQRKNVVVTEGALNPVAEDYLKSQARSLKPMRKTEGGLVLGVLIGGDNKGFRLERDLMQGVIRQLKEFSQSNNAELLVTTSRRTPPPVEALVRQEFADYPRCKLLIIANEKNMPFVAGGIMGLSSVIVTSPESISMISEAANSKRPVLVFDAPKIGAKHRRFISRLAANKNIFLCGVSDLHKTLGEVWLQKPEMSGLNDSLRVKEAIERIL